MSIYSETFSKKNEHFRLKGSGLQSMTVILDWFMNPNQAPILLAEAKDIFKKEGLDIQFVEPADPNDPPKLVAAGQADLAIDYLLQYRYEKIHHLPIEKIGVLIPVPLTCLAVLSSSTIKALSDLKGKTIGYSTPTTDIVVIKALLKKGGLTAKDVRLINVHYGLAQSLLTHRVDAVIGFTRNFEPLQLAEKGQPVRLFFPEDYGIETFGEMIYVQHSPPPHPERTAHFLRATKLATRFLINHPEEAWQITIARYPKLNSKLNHRIWLKSTVFFCKTARFVLTKK